MIEKFFGVKVAIAGTGYDGLSNAVLLARHHEVVALDIVPEYVATLNRKESTIVNDELEGYLQHKPLNLRAMLEKREADVIIANRITDNIRDVADKIYTLYLSGSD